MIRTFLAFFMILVFIIWMVGPAPAADVLPGCVAKLPAERTGYWRYRIIKGRKCWYEPRRGRVTVEQARATILPPVDVVEWHEHNRIDAAAPPMTDFQWRWMGQ